MHAAYWRAQISSSGAATSVAPAGHESEAPEIPVQRPEPGELLRKAVLDEPRPCPPRLHQRAHVVRRSPSEEHEGCIRKERVEIRDAEAALRRLVDEARAARPQASRGMDVLALARRDVRRGQCVRVPAALTRVVELIPEDVPLALNRAQAGAPKQRLQQHRRSGPRAPEHEDRALGWIERGEHPRERSCDARDAAPNAPDSAANAEELGRLHALELTRW